MAYLGRNDNNDLVFQQGTVNLKIGIPATGRFDFIVANSGADFPAFNQLNVNPSGTSNLATVASGNWQATVISEAYGGTGQASYNPGDILVADGAQSLTTLASGAEGQHLAINAGALGWVDPPTDASPVPLSIETAATVNLTNADYYTAVSGVGLVTVNLPASPVVGQVHIVKDRQGIAASSGITIDGNGNQIDGFPSALMNTNYQALTLVWDGAQWNIT